MPGRTMSETSDAAPPFPMTLPDFEDVLAVFERVALGAGRQILVIAREGIAAETKADASVVTRADRDAEAIILAELSARFPAFPVVAEEAMASGAAPDIAGNCFFL